MAKRLFWIDLEMTGLDETVDHILEVAVVVTDAALNPLDTFHRVVFQPREVMDNMNDWCREHHGKSGLTADVARGRPQDEIERDLITFSAKYFPAAVSPKAKKDDKIVLAGNSVGNDRRFIDRHMPHFAGILHYRMVDVSSFKEVFRGRYGVKFEKKNSHRAVTDILESIDELKHYLSFVNLPMRPPNEPEPSEDKK